jgi:transcription elongation factor Elf1
MRQYRYISNRILSSKSGEEKGKMRILVKVDSDNAEVDYTCPECENQEHVVKPWKRPFSVKCSKCSFLMRAPKLKGKK